MADRPCENIIVKVPGTDKPDEIMVIGAYYHSAEDTPDKMDFDRYAAVVSMLVPVISDLAK